MNIGFRTVVYQTFRPRTSIGNRRISRCLKAFSGRIDTDRKRRAACYIDITKFKGEVVIKFFNNRQLAERLGINLARWKRWSREFLPPDPLGGMQSGYARQYNPDDAFSVYLAGHLVAALKFSVPESRKILHDLKGWMGARGFAYAFSLNSAFETTDDFSIRNYVVFIRRKQLDPPKKIEFFYTVRGIISAKPVQFRGATAVEELYVETAIGKPSPTTDTLVLEAVKILKISAVLENFALRMGLDRMHYPVLR